MIHDEIRINTRSLSYSDQLLFRSLSRYARTDKTGMARIFLDDAARGRVTLQLLREIVAKADTSTPEGRSFKAYAQRQCDQRDPAKYADVLSVWWGDPSPILRRYGLKGRFLRLRELDMAMQLLDNS